MKGLGSNPSSRVGHCCGVMVARKCEPDNGTVAEVVLRAQA